MPERDPEKTFIVYEPTTAAHHQEDQQDAINDTQNEISESVEAGDQKFDNLEAEWERPTLFSIDQQQDQIQNGNHTDPAHSVTRNQDFAPGTQDSDTKESLQNPPSALHIRSGQLKSKGMSIKKQLTKKKTKRTTVSKVSDYKMFQRVSPHDHNPSTLPDSSSPNSKDSCPSSDDSSSAFSSIMDHFLEAGPVFIQRLRDVYGPIVLINEEDRFDVNLASFQRVQLEVLQKRLLDVIFGFAYKKANTIEEARYMQQTIEKSSRLMSRYVQAWKDLEFMTNVGKHGEYDPFIVSADINIQRAALLQEADSWSSVPADHIRPELREELEKLRQNICGRRPTIDSEETEDTIIMGGGTRSSINDKRRVEDRVKKTLMAVAGGAFLIVPMLIMVLSPGKITSLVTTSVFVFVFGLSMSLSPFLERPFDVLSATAAYAAVLVVFVGTGGGT